MSFVYKEMEKNNYIVKLFHPKKKNKKILKKAKREKESNIFNIQSSATIINQKSEEKKLFFSSKKLNNFKSKLDLKKNKDEKNTISVKKKSSKNNLKSIELNSNYNSPKTNKKTSNSTIKIYNQYKMKNKVENKISKKNIKLNKGNNRPGYYNLIRIDANNSLKNDPLDSKYILDNYNFDDAIEYDKRDYLRIIYICLLSKDNILNTFYFNSPLEIQSLRLTLFILSYSCDFALNALFYFNQNISDKYHYDGDSLYLFIFVNNLLITVFSTIFSYSVIKILSFLTNSKEAIEELFRKEEELMRRNKNYRVNNNKKKIINRNILKIFKCLKYKIVCYIIIEFLIMLFFFYFITAFCEVYKETQFSWLYDSFTSFLFSFPLELIISFIITILYKNSIQIKNKCIYNISISLYDFI
jgi:hypothetical protein